MWKSKLIFRFILSVAAIATSVQLNSASDYAIAQSASSNPTVESGQQNRFFSTCYAKLTIKMPA
ncbi:hypothetical protein [Nostoc sp.]|uniref:hypothetical protein n=1 Tax=Nostoc sp. TaxID=1180 RepID=UPI002FF5CCFF